jgi:hypothetical protein
LKTIGITLSDLGETKGLFLGEVGAQLLLDLTNLSKIELEERMPTLDQVKLLADFYKHQKNEVIIASLSDKLFNEVKKRRLDIKGNV